MEFDWKFWSSVFTLSGSIVGAGILGLPYVFSLSGFAIGAFWVVFLGFVVAFSMMYLVDVIVHTKGRHQLAGLAGLYLGPVGKWVMLVAFMSGIYAALLAYLVGEGNSLSVLFFGDSQFALYCGLCFWFVMLLLVGGGLNRLRTFEVVGVFGILIIVIGLFMYHFISVDWSVLGYVDFSYVWLPFAVTLFALLGFPSLPEVCVEMKGRESELYRVVRYGVGIPVVLYLVFSFVFVGLYSDSLGEIATLSSGAVLLLLGMFTMFTSYLVLSFALRDVFLYDLGLSSRISFFLSQSTPLFLYLLVVFFEWDSFVRILGWGGVISGGLTGIMILCMHYSFTRYRHLSVKRVRRFPILPTHWFLVISLLLVYGFGIIRQLFL